MSTGPNNNNSFMDTRTWIAIGLSAVVFFGWQTYISKKYPDYYKPKVQTETAPAAPTGATASSGPAAAPSAAALPPSPTEAPAGPSVTSSEEQFVSYKDDNVDLVISSHGMALKRVQLLKYPNPEKTAPTILGVAQSGGLFGVGIAGQKSPVIYAIEKTGDHSFQGTALVGGMKVIQTLVIDPETSKIDTTVHLENVSADFRGLTVTSYEARQEHKSGGMFMPNLDHQELVTLSDDKVDRVQPKDGENVEKEYSIASFWGMGSQYFVTAAVDQSAVMPRVRSSAPGQGDLKNEALYAPATIQSEMEFKWISYAGGKSMAHLEKVHPEFVRLVNFGFFSPIGKILLKVLIWWHGLIGNWGWAIILLTLMVRLIVLPFNISSYKSMKKMQAVQPQLQALRERYKDDPATLNSETMALMRKEKANPIGGCLPIFLQMPVFFALYQVLGQSIELYQAPFMLWIHDLSQKDPFYVLPAVMGITMFIQQKITPTAMDPTQAKILMWMPVIFSVFTLGLPSGLTLYISVSTLFGVTQQQLFMHDRKAAKKA